MICGLLRLLSTVACMIVLASFAIFVVHQSGSASAHQLHTLDGQPGTSGGRQAGHDSALHRDIDRAANALTSPFSRITSRYTSQWTIHILDTLLTLLLYGLVLGYLVRLIRMRA